MKWMLTAAFLLASVAWGQSDPDPTLPVLSRGTTLLWDHCGGEGDPACVPSDPAYFQLPQHGFVPVRCDITLDPIAVNGTTICKDIGRRSSPTVRARLTHLLDSQQTDQYARIEADLPINYAAILGTHNSFSNFQDGGNNRISVDQSLTITDQLWLGARHVRIDPIRKADGSSVMVCHMSPVDVSAMARAFAYFNLTIPSNAPEICGSSFNPPAPAIVQGSFSYGRPFYLALREVRVWLDRNPGAVIVLNVNNFFGPTEPGYVDKVDVNAIVAHELGSKLLKPSDFPNGWSGAWPTGRQILAAHKQGIAKFGGPFDSTSYAWPDADDKYPGNATDDGTFGFCIDPRFGTPIGYGRKPHWENLGEDRSLSDIGNPGGQKGLIGPFEVETAMYCGFSMVALDFFYALDQATKAKAPPLLNIDFTGGMSQPCGSCDDRPQAMIWSWNRPEDPSQSMPATLQRPPLVIPQFPPWLTRTRGYRWTQAHQDTQLPFACAGKGTAGDTFPAAGQDLGHSWKVASSAGQWFLGEKKCQELGSDYHFWKPMTSPENQALMDAMDAAGVQRVWLNHFPKATRVQPDFMDITYVRPNPAPVKNIIVAGGFGGALSAEFIPDAGFPNFLTVTPSSPAGFVFQVSANTAVLDNRPVGTFTGVVRVTETHPDDGSTTSAEMKVNLAYTNAGLVATPATVDFRSGLVQTVSITATSGPINFLPDNVRSEYMSVEDCYQSPCQTTYTLNIANSPKSTSFTQFLRPIDNSPRAFVHFNISLSDVTAASSPPEVPITIDGGAPVTSATRRWVTGSTHQLAAPATYQLAGSTFLFTGWSDGVTAVSRTFTPSADGTLTANYQVSRPLTLAAAPSQGGSFLVNGAPPQATYPDGTTITVTAVPASGYIFKQYTGDAANQSPSIQVVMNGAKLLQGVFAPATVPKTTLTTSPAGLLLVVDGLICQTPVSFPWAAGESHTVATSVQLAAPLSGTRFTFSSWSDGNSSATRTFGGSAADVSYTANFFIENLLTVNVTPAAAGTVSGAGWYRANQVAPVSATPASGFVFAGFSGGVNSATSPVPVSMNTPLTVTATFQAARAPVLYAASSARTDLGGGVVSVPVVISNLGPGPAGNTVLTAIDGFQTPQGAGGVSAAVPPGGIALGTIMAGSKAQTVVNFQWPSSATRVTFTVHYTANGGAYQGANAITLFR